ncbi:MAG: type II 3-dehydroquinate dehydratase [SAR86 cluster bacterium]|jgi:3-dehydroquinate dehydratase-2|nr:MAG: type II 3-dehydroquinate dehydratase [SAR86 cluster bacterium]URQ69708.1 type II 3-dehydroquinate dehydratase [SAR86 cluster bacterium]|tara:strand:- start:1261 stop:1695 length:435 start_codon:yes stop_codon:yes gene_type:complete
MKILVLNGPNLNLLGKRENDIYGEKSLEQVISKLEKTAKENDCVVESFQSNAEHELINKIQDAKTSGYSAIIINPGAFTHTSIAMRDAFLATKIPFYEVHITDIYKREKFRHNSFFSDIAEKSFIGEGVDGYENALKEVIGNFR